MTPILNLSQTNSYELYGHRERRVLNAVADLAVDTKACYFATQDFVTVYTQIMKMHNAWCSVLLPVSCSPGANWVAQNTLF